MASTWYLARYGIWKKRVFFTRFFVYRSSFITSSFVFLFGLNCGVNIEESNR